MQHFRPDHVDIGIDAPLDQTGRVRPLDQVHRISPRWLAGALLTGVAGAAMMGGAILGTLEGAGLSGPTAEARNIALAPPPAPLQQITRGLEPEPGAPERQERLIKPVDIALAKRSFEAKVMVKSGEREILQSRRYTRVSAPLEAHGSAGRAIPRFNPMILISEANANRNFSRVTTREDPDADVSIVTADLAATAAPFAEGALDDEAALAQANQALNQAGGASIGDSPLTMLERVMSADEDEIASPELIAFTPLPGSPFAKLEVRLVPENFLDLQKLGGGELTVLHREEVATIGKDASAAAAMREAKVEPAIAEAAADALLAASGRKAFETGSRLKLRFALSPTDSARPAELVTVTLYADNRVQATIGRRDDGGFSAAPSPEAPSASATAKGDRLTVFASIYETALRQDAPRALVDELVRVYSYDVDFQRPVSASDSIDFLYAEPEQGSEEQGELLRVAITLGGETKEYYRFQDKDDGSVDFYDPKGRSGRKFLLRMPLPSGELRSGFGWRRHPILGYMKMHTGVDWSNKVGTPILAAGNGVVRKAAWDTGYGRRVEIEHANGYATTYSHMSAFGDGIEDGVRVRQGQIIGYLGSSGLSTGPHLHYEVIVNDNFLDPMAIRLPRGKELDGEELVSFKTEKDRIDGLVQKSQTGGTTDLAVVSAD
jgi:murein DD-endopeptidase MepM/ murein hydrolase activator NlpD